MLEKGQKQTCGNQADKGFELLRVIYTFPTHKYLIVKNSSIP